jgi:hypothetical protein
MHYFPFQAEFTGHYEHCPMIKYEFFFSQTQVLEILLNEAPIGHCGINSHKSPVIKYPYLQLHLAPESETTGDEFKGHLKGIQAIFQSLQMYPSLQTHFVCSAFKDEKAGQATQDPLTKKKFCLQIHFFVASSNC